MALPPAHESAEGPCRRRHSSRPLRTIRPHVTGPDDSVEKLDELDRWATLDSAGTDPSTGTDLMVGIEVCEVLGWIIDPGSKADADDMETLRTRAAG
ncbi:hypothetical protein [Rhodococcus qingshengii]